MKIIVCEHAEDVRMTIEANYADFVVSLDPADEGFNFGYGRCLVANPVARHEGCAVIAEIDGDEADSVPDPFRFIVRRASYPLEPSLVQIRRRALPVVITIDSGNGKPTSVTVARLTASGGLLSGEDRPFSEANDVLGSSAEQSTDPAEDGSGS
jgi:hypothetical protein